MNVYRGLLSLYEAIVTNERLENNLWISGLGDGHKSWLASLMAASNHHVENNRNATLVFVLADPKRLHEWQDILQLNNNLMQDIPWLQALSHWGVQRHASETDQRHERLRVLTGLASEVHRPHACLVSIAGLLQETCDPISLRNSIIFIESGKDYDLDEILSRLRDQGYLPVAEVQEIGQFAIRGGLLDIFSPAEHSPIRIEFMADTVASLRYFNVESQLSLDECQRCSLSPVWEVGLSKERRDEHAQKIYEVLLEQKISPSDRQGIVDSFREGRIFSEMALFLPILRDRPGICLIDYLQANDKLIFLDSIESCFGRFEQFSKKIFDEYCDDISSMRATLDPKKHFLSWGTFAGRLKKTGGQVHFSSLSDQPDEDAFHLGSILPVDLVVPIGSEKDTINHFLVRLSEFSNQARRCIILVRQKEHILRMKSVLKYHNIQFDVYADSGVDCFRKLEKFSHSIVIAVGFIPELIWDDRESLLVLPEHKVFCESYKAVKKTKKSVVEAFKSFRDIDVGGLVVHVEHGVARYMGMRSMEVSGVRTDFLILEYQDQDKLYLPVHRLQLLHRYSSLKDLESQPNLDKLQSTGWQKRKSKAQKSIRDMTDQLIRIYAKRKLEKRSPFSQPTDFYYQFEADFSYIETDDQQKAIDDVNSDLSSDQPMDRLICGDVGFGKTEVALRAAMRVVSDGGQVMVLAPTTLLSYQHFETFKSRFKAYDVTVGIANRFVKKSSALEVINNFNNGSLDILVGTHRLLSKDLKPNRLGLLIVDEEQRFGVAHKEAIKKLKASCDILTLTATPIPRSLHMSLLGIRDISVIATPPSERLAIRTYLAPFDEHLIKKAIEQELSRGGQVFFVHNQVRDILDMKIFLEEILPQARVAVVHGQMHENNIETVVLDFIQQKFSVLLCTTIIESGIDMPNVNTIIVNQADRFGLSQLYQMRGRVGRSSRQSYAWFLTHGSMKNRADAQRRLEILAAHQELGVGFQIASYDMELRGTGNLLGGEQSGYLADVGFDMYMSLLEKEMINLREGDQELDVDPEIRIPVSASLPSQYISEEKQRLWLYKSLFSADDLIVVDRLVSQTRDRFGQPPGEAESLFKVASLKIILRKIRAQQITQIRDQLFEVRFAKLGEDQIRHLVDSVQINPNRLSLTLDFRLLIRLGGEGDCLIDLLENLMPLTLIV